MHTSGPRLRRAHRSLRPAETLAEDGTLKAPESLLPPEDTTTGNTSPPEKALGNLDCMAPEVLWGEEGTPASDMFSFAVLAHELLSGKKLFNEWDRNARALGIVVETTGEFETICPHLPREVTDMLNACFEEEPANRPKAHVLAEALAPYFSMDSMLNPPAKSA
jgi:serine/threonine protein kinase